MKMKKILVIEEKELLFNPWRFDDGRIWQQMGILSLVMLISQRFQAGFNTVVWNDRAWLFGGTICSNFD